MADGSVVYEVRADTGNLGADLDKANSSVLGASSGMGGVAMGVAKGIGAAFVAAGASVIKFGSDFESRLSSIKAVSGATQAEMEAISQAALDAGARTSFSAEESAAAIEELIKAGLTTQQVLEGGLAGALDLAAAGEISVADAATIASTALNAFRDDNLSVSDAANILAGAANASATDVAGLRLGLSMVAPVAAGMGMSFADTATALAVFAQNGMRGSDSGTSLKTMLMNLQPMTAKQRKEFERLGLMTFDTEKAMKTLRDNGVQPLGSDSATLEKQLRDLATEMSGAKEGSQKASEAYDALATQAGITGTAFYDANGSMRSLSEISAILQTSLTGMTDAQRAMSLEVMFGSDAIRAGNILYREGADGVIAMSAAMENVTAADVAATRLDNFKGSMENLKGAAETIAISMYQQIQEPLNETVKSVTAGLNELAADGSLSALASTIGSVGSALGESLIALLPVAIDLMNGLILPIAQLIETVLPPLIDLFGQIIPPVSEMIQKLMPFLVDYFSKLIPPITEIITKMLPPLVRLFDSLLPIVGDLLELLTPLIDIFMTLLDPIVNIIDLALIPLIDIIAQVIDFAIKPLQDYLGFLKEDFERIFKTVAEFVIEQVNRIIDIFKNIIDFIKNVFTGNWSGAWENVKNIFGGIWDGLVNSFKFGINFIIDGINNFIRGLNRIEIPDWVPLIGGMGINLPEIPRLKVGMDYVPSDDFPAFLHRGEAVLTSGDADVWRGLGGVSGIERILSIQPQFDAFYKDALAAADAGGGGDTNIGNIFGKAADYFVVREESDIDKIADALMKKINRAKRERGGG